MDIQNWQVKILFLFIITAITVKGDLYFEPFGDAPAIYEGAEPGVEVLQVQALDSNSSDTEITYNILDVKDHTYFTIDQDNGKIANSKVIDVHANYTFELLIVAMANGQTEVNHVLINVVKKNEFPPKFSKSIYETDILLYSSPGTHIIQVSATDEDMQRSGLIYHLQHFTNDKISTSNYFMISSQTGKISLTKRLGHLNIKELELFVIAEDRGSPKLFGSAIVKIHFKKISAPRGLYANALSDTSIKICWSKPKYGKVEGYNITYKKISSNNNLMDILMSKDQLWSIKIASSLRSLCYVIEDLQPWVNYNFSVFGWNNEESGFVSKSYAVTTRPDFE